MDKTTPQDSKKSRTFQILLGIITNLSNLAPGITLGFSAILLPALKEGPEQINDEQGSWIASVASITMPIGCLMSGPILDRYGRKVTLYTVNIVSIIGWIIIASSPTDPNWVYSMLLTGRVVTGIATGMGSIPATVYLSEISTPKLRAMLATWTSVFIAVGVCIIYILGYFIRENWRLSAIITIFIPTIALILIYLIMPESPLWLVNRNQIPEAEKSLARLWRVNLTSPFIKDELDRMIENSQSNHPMKELNKSLGLKIRRKIQYFLKPGCLKPFMIMVSYFFFQQFSGTFVIVFYAVNIVEKTGVKLDSYLIAVIIGLSRVVASFIVGPVCRHYGRRPPSIISGVGMSVCMISLAIYMYLVSSGSITQEKADNLSFLPVLLIILYFFTSTLGFLTIPFAMIAEMYPSKIRGLAGGLTACFCYIFNFITVKTYSDMLDTMQEYGLYAFYATFSIIGTIFVVFCLPETKGKTLQEIEDYFSGKSMEKRKLEERTELNTEK